MDVKVEGKRAFVHDGGLRFDRTDTVAVLLHGAGSDHTVWRHHSRNLAHRGLGVLAPDLPGHGRSEGPALPSIEAMAGWTGALLDELNVGSASLVGHSMGSLVALDCAAGSPDRVDKLVLIATSDRMAVHPDLQEAADAADPLAIDLIMSWSHTGSHRLGGHPTPGVWAELATRRLLEKSLGGSLGTDLYACSHFDGSARAGAVRCPTLVVGGSADAMTPAGAGRRIAAAIPGANFELLDGAGHSALFTDPERIRRLLEAFLIR